MGTSRGHPNYVASFFARIHTQTHTHRYIHTKHDDHTASFDTLGAVGRSKRGGVVAGHQHAATGRLTGVVLRHLVNMPTTGQLFTDRQAPI